MQREELNFVLQHSDLTKLESLYKKIDKTHGVTVVNQPTSQTLLVPIKDPISGGEFYAGEVLVTSSIVSVDNAQGWAMVQDDNEKLSLYIASIDAVFESKEFENEINELYQETLQTIEKEKAIINQKVNSTKVSFDLM
jgi:alpha-D-ribose 1-methylphosphonate 5-triphosphate synthase subunit PhnG